jgi:hypothetical protein
MHLFKNSLMLVLTLMFGVSNLAFARDLKMELPIATATANASWLGMIGPSIQFKFGDDPISGSIEKLVELKKMEHYARPYIIRGSRRVNRDDATTCNEALRNVLADAADIAKTSGANVVVMHSSDYDSERPTDAKRYYLCNSGTNSSTVNVSISVFRVSAAAAQPASVPVKVLVAPTPLRPTPISSGYADVYDIAKLPASNESCKKLYAEWLSKPNPKAFTMSGEGKCFYSFSLNPADKSLPIDPTERTLLNCNRSTKGANDCKHYAIDGVVVWKP